MERLRRRAGELHRVRGWKEQRYGEGRLRDVPSRQVRRKGGLDDVHELRCWPVQRHGRSDSRGCLPAVRSWLGERSWKRRLRGVFYRQVRGRIWCGNVQELCCREVWSASGGAERRRLFGVRRWIEPRWERCVHALLRWRVPEGPHGLALGAGGVPVAGFRSAHRALGRGQRGARHPRCQPRSEDDLAWSLGREEGRRVGLGGRHATRLHRLGKRST